MNSPDKVARWERSEEREKGSDYKIKEQIETQNKTDKKLWVSCGSTCQRILKVTGFTPLGPWMRTKPHWNPAKNYQFGIGHKSLETNTNMPILRMTNTMWPIKSLHFIRHGDAWLFSSRTFACILPHIPSDQQRNIKRKADFMAWIQSVIHPSVTRYNGYLTLSWSSADCITS